MKAQPYLEVKSTPASEGSQYMQLFVRLKETRRRSWWAALKFKRLRRILSRPCECPEDIHYRTLSLSNNSASGLLDLAFVRFITIISPHSCNYWKEISWYGFRNPTDKQSQSFGFRLKMYACNPDRWPNNPRGHLHYSNISDVQTDFFNRMPHWNRNHIIINCLKGKFCADQVARGSNPINPKRIDDTWPAYLSILNVISETWQIG